MENGVYLCAGQAAASRIYVIKWHKHKQTNQMDELRLI